MIFGTQHPDDDDDDDSDCMPVSLLKSSTDTMAPLIARLANLLSLIHI